MKLIDLLNPIPTEREINKSVFLTGCFSLRSKDALRRDFLDRSCFFDKNFQFLSKKQLRSDRFPPSTPFFA